MSRFIFFQRSYFYYGQNQINYLMLNLLSSFILEDYEFQEIWEIKSVRFKAIFEKKYYQVILGQSQMVYDIKGNPQIKGTFLLTNLRIVWHAPDNKNMNLSIGLDSVHQIFLHESPICNCISYILIIKAIDGQARYGFKFSGFTKRQSQLFIKTIELIKQITKTKQFRDITISTNPINPIQTEQIKSTYEKGQLEIDSRRISVFVTLTNARIIIVKKQGRYGDKNYGLPWICISTMSQTNAQYGRALKIVCRSMPNKVFYLGCKDNGQKMLKQIISFGETYSKHPFFGVQVEYSLISSTNATQYIFTEIQEIVTSKVNIIQSTIKNYRHHSQVGSIEEAQFDEQLGIMMEKHPQGLSRENLWQIFKQ